MTRVVVEYIVYTDRHENFPRDSKRKVRIVTVAACAADIRARTSHTAPNLCRGI